MFEDSLFASRVAVRPARSRWAAVIAALVQGVMVAGLLIAPMLRPLALPMLKTAPAVVSVNLRRAEVKVEPVKVRPAVTSSDTAIHAPGAAATMVLQTRGGGRISAPSDSQEAGPLMLATGPGMGTGVGIGVGIGFGPGGMASPVVRVKSSVPLRVSSGVSSGMLLAPIHPVYPAIAKATRIEGTVVISARIDKVGRIVGLQVTSGPEALRTAAVDAVREARYRPFLLNGEATEVETTIVVNFRMGG